MNSKQNSTIVETATSPDPVAVAITLLVMSLAVVLAVVGSDQAIYFFVAAVMSAVICPKSKS